MRFDNYYENKLIYENGNLVSTKKDIINHGYGIKSIKHIVVKYNGTVKIITEDNWFGLCILIPINNAHKGEAPDKPRLKSQISK